MLCCNKNTQHRLAPFIEAREMKNICYILQAAFEYGLSIKRGANSFGFVSCFKKIKLE